MKNTENIQNIFAFVLGREQKIARAELESVLRHFCFYFHLEQGREVDITSLSGNVVFYNIERGDDFKKSNIMSVLGGTMEIYQIIDVANNIDPDAIYSQIARISKEHKGRVTFGLSDYSNTYSEARLNALGIEVKKKLKENGSARFVALRGDNRLSAAAIISNRLHKDGVQIGIFESEKRIAESGKQFLIGRLIGVSDPTEWSKRDFDKPRSDKFAGMTPPKLARALINIALSQPQTSNLKPQTCNSKLQTLKTENREPIIGRYNDFVVVDPFCGSGNILIEAADLGCGVIGSDISNKAVLDTKANLAWLSSQTSNLKPQTYNLKTEEQSRFVYSRDSYIRSSSPNKLIPNSYNLFVADATKSEFVSILANKLITKKLKSCVIVTEPYLGNPKKFKPTMNAVKGEYSKVKRLYIDFLRNVLGIKNVSGIRYKVLGMAIMFPLIETMEGERYSLFSESIDEIKQMGYTLLCEPFVYGREYQVVKRQIAFLYLKPQNSNLKTKS